MSFFATWSYGPAYLEVFLDMISLLLISDIVAVTLLLYLICRPRKKSHSIESNNGYDNAITIESSEKIITKSESRTLPEKPTIEGWSQTEEYLLLSDKQESESDQEEDDTENASTQTQSQSFDDKNIQTEPVEDVVKVVTDAIQILPNDEVLSTPKARPPLDRRKSRDNITFRSGWRKTVKLLDLIKANVILESRVEELEREEVTEEEIENELRPYLVGENPIAGITIKETGQKMSLYHAYKQGLISRGTAVSLLEAQAATGSIIDAETGQKMSVGDAKTSGLIDRQFEAVLNRAERAVTGYSVRGSQERISLFQAMKQGKVVEKHGIRLLEAQIATGGLIDPEANHRLPIEAAFERGLFDERLHEILEDPSDDTKGFLDPNTNENLSYLELIQRCQYNENNDLLYLPVVPDNERQTYLERHSSTNSQQSFSGRRSRSSIGGSFSGMDD